MAERERERLGGERRRGGEEARLLLGILPWVEENRSVGGAKVPCPLLPASLLSGGAKLLPASLRLGGDCLIGGQLCTAAVARDAFGEGGPFLSERSENLEPIGATPPLSRCVDFQVL